MWCQKNSRIESDFSNSARQRRLARAKASAATENFKRDLENRTELLR